MTELKYKKIKLFSFYKRQEGLERKNELVFDDRYYSVINPDFFSYLKTISNTFRSKVPKKDEGKEIEDNSEDENNESKIKFMTNYSPPKFIRNNSGIFVKSEKPYIVSGNVPEGVYSYSCCGSHESDPQYVAMRSSKEGIKTEISRLRSLEAKKIVFGLEVDSYRLDILFREFNKVKKHRKIEEILKLPIEEQRKILEKLL